jgi:hypothetical protein
MAPRPGAAGRCSVRPKRPCSTITILYIAMASEIVYIAQVDATGRTFWARIARVGWSKTGRTAYYGERALRGEGQPWYRDVQTGEQFHIQHVRDDGLDRSEGHKRGGFPIEIDDDVREEYWTRIRRQPHRGHERVIRS